MRLPQETPFPPTDNGRNFLAALAAAAGDLWSEDAEGPRRKFVLLVRAGSSPRLIWLLNPDEDILASFDVIQPIATRSRVEAQYQILPTRRVGIVGAGSVGSKIAVSLARSGTGLFFLVDEDILLPDNLVRNDLDWLAVGMHKVDGLARRLALVNPGADITMNKVMLAGQEASSSVAAALERLADCDLVIDATADPAVFNVLAGFTADARKPFVWVEVLEGGIGGIVARYRPENEPSPHTMRARISAWCTEQGVPWTREAVDYASLDDSGIPIVADDSEVSVIAAHATRFALDTLLARTPSLFPYPVYVVGLRRGWIFNEPFQTRPVNVGGPDKTEDQPGSLPPNAASETLKFVADLIETKVKLLLPAEIRHRLEHELRRAGTAEIGGVLMGEHVGPNTFRILDLTVDRRGGSFARFVRAMGKHRFGLDAFFRRTGKQFSKFNYLGEWHSHPSFQLTPSGTDLSTMRSIVDDPAVGALFAVLVIVCLSTDGEFEARASLFRPANADIHPVDFAAAEA